MTMNNPKSGFGAAGEFQSSALPFVTASQAPIVSGGVLRIDLPKVSRFFTVSNHDSTTKYLRIGFTLNGVQNGGNYFKLDGGQTCMFELRVKSLFFAGDTTLTPFSLMAGLTTVDAKDMPVLSGTLPDGTAGWTGVG